MKPEQVDECLRNYKEYSARCEFLQHDIHEMKMLVERLRQNALTDAVSISSPSLSGMPHGNDISDPTGNVAIKFADGFVPQYIVDMEKEIQAKEAEYREKFPTIVFVEAWLKALNARERLIVEGKMINGLFWRELVNAYRNEFDEVYSKHGLKGILDRALDKIYKVAK